MRPLKARLIVPVLLLTLVALSVSGGAGTTERTLSADRAAGPAAVNAYRALPLAFVRNAGQLDRRVRFSAQAGSASVFLTRSEAVVALGKGRQGLALRLRFLGASPRATLSGAERSPGRVNYLIRNDPSRWQQDLPTYREVVYRRLWPGVDLAVRGRGGQLKYEFRLAPGSDPARIRLAYRGQERLSLDRDGRLRVETALGTLRDNRPVSYQPIGRRRVAVESSFALRDGGAYGFALGAYDRHRPLVIDPGLAYSTYLGEGSATYGQEIAVDDAGSAYVTGSTYSIDFPTTAGAFDTSRNGGDRDIFVTKLNAARSDLEYSTYLGGGEAGGIAVDRAGSAYVTGTTGFDFPTTPDAFDPVGHPYAGRNMSDAFVTKLNADGSALAYSTFLGGTPWDYGEGIAVDDTGSAYVVGSTQSGDFPTTPGAFDRSRSANADPTDTDVFVTKLNPSGSALGYSTYLGGRDMDGYEHLGIAVDDAGSAYIIGNTSSTDFPTTAGAFDRSPNDLFVTKLNAAGSRLAYSTYLGGTGDDYGQGIAVDDRGSAYVTGYTELAADFPTTAGAFDTSYNKGGDLFVTKLNAAGSALAYSTYLGGRGLDGGDEVAIAVDRAGSAYVTGSTDSTNFPTTAGAIHRRYKGGLQDAFVTRLTGTGSALLYSTYIGGSDDDVGGGIAVHDVGAAYVTGSTSSRDFPTTPRAFQQSYNRGKGTALVMKLDLRDLFYVEPNHGLTQEIRDEFPGYSAIDYWQAHLAARRRFGPNYLRGIRKYLTAGGDLRLSSPGAAYWAPEVQTFLRDRLSRPQHGPKLSRQSSHRG